MTSSIDIRTELATIRRYMLQILNNLFIEELNFSERILIFDVGHGHVYFVVRVEIVSVGVLRHLVLYAYSSCN